MVFNDCICFQLGALARKITRHYKEKLSSLGLTHGQFFMLVALYDEDGLLPSQLADKTALDRPTITGLLDRLERDGWTERRPEPSDRRVLRIHLTSKALQVREAILSIFEETNGQFVRRFSQDEWVLFQSFLNRLEAS
jgi:MarR family transcriptional regulator, organic hydroperoxide resistance regulator